MYLGGSEDQRKLYLVKWDVLCKPMEEGCMGLRGAEEMNKALLAKLGWRLLKDLNAL